MTDPLTTEQIELLRGLTVPCLDVRDVSQAESFAQMHKCGLVYAPPILPYNGEHEWRRLESADTLLATLDHQRDQIIGEIEGLAGDYADSGRSYESADIARALNDFAGRLANNLKEDQDA